MYHATPLGNLLTVGYRFPRLFGGQRDHEVVLENTMKLQENMTTIRGNSTKSPGKRTKTERMLGTN